MKRRMIWHDLMRNKVITLMILLFISVASMLLALATVLGVSLFGSIDRLMQDAKTPHFMQMSTGDADLDTLESFAASRDDVSQFQVLSFLNMDSDKIRINESSLTGTLQDNGFCTQSGQFDFLLDLNGIPVKPMDGELYAPVFYNKDGTINMGDIVTVNGLQFTVSGFVRDSQMNSALAYSKRFVVSEADYAKLEPFGKAEHLIEFRLYNLSDLGQFAAAYSAAGLPANGPTLTWPLFRMISAISDGMMIAVILLISILVILIALLCIRFALLAKIEEDYREIGVMKALGMRVSDIRSLYLSSYAAIAAAGSILGLFLALLFYRPMASGIRLNFGDGKNSIVSLLPGLASVLFLFCFILFYINFNLRRFRKISAAEAIRFGMSSQESATAKTISLSKNVTTQNKFFQSLPTNLFLGIWDVRIRKRLYGTMLAVIILAAFIIIVPQNLYYTISAKNFVTYMGIGLCDLRVDLQQSEELDKKAEQIAAFMESDTAISEYTMLITKTFGVKLENGTNENIKIELGDHTVFPVQYVKGRMPLSEEEIALSSINADEWGKTTGDKLTVLTKDGEKVLNICGVYSDISNGGKTAKAVFSDNSTNVAWSIIYARLTDPMQVAGIREQYANQFPFAKVSDIDDYVSQTFGQTVLSVRMASIVSIFVAAAVTLLVTLLFLKLLVAKDCYSIAVMKAMGFTSKDVKRQYLWRIVTILAIGIVLGMILSVTLGEKLAGMAISSFGAAAFQFVVNLPVTLLFCPLVMILAALIAVTAGTTAIKGVNIAQSIKE